MKWKPKQKKALWVQIRDKGKHAKKPVFRRPNPISVQRRADKAEYDRRRKKFIAENPLCQCCIALGEKKPQRSKEVHHKRGRKGSNYLNVATWLATCPPHHMRIHREPAWAREHGFLGSFITG